MSPPKSPMLYSRHPTCTLCHGPAVPMRSPRSVRYRISNTLPSWMHDLELLGLPHHGSWLRSRVGAKVPCEGMRWVVFHKRCLDLAVDMLRHLNIWAQQGWLGTKEEGKGPENQVEMEELIRALEKGEGEGTSERDVLGERELTVLVKGEWGSGRKKFWWLNEFERNKWLAAVPDSLPVHKPFTLLPLLQTDGSSAPSIPLTASELTSSALKPASTKSSTNSQSKPAITRPRTFIDPPPGSHLARLTPDFTLSLISHLPPTALPSLAFTHPCFAEYLCNSHRSPQLNAKWKECVLSHFGYALWPWEWVERDEEAVPVEGKGSSKGVDWAEMWRSCWASKEVRNTIRLADKVEIAWRIVGGKTREANKVNA